MPAFGLEFSQSENIAFLQKKQLPHAIGNGTTTRSPRLGLPTAPPTSTTSPMNSWPRMSPFTMPGTKRAARRHVLEPRRHDRAAPPRRIAQRERTEMQQLLAAHRAPHQLLARGFARELDFAFRRERQVFSPLPERVHLFARPRDGDGLFHHQGLGNVCFRGLLVYANAKRVEHRVADGTVLVQDPAA